MAGFFATRRFQQAIELLFSPTTVSVHLEVVNKKSAAVPPATICVLPDGWQRALCDVSVFWQPFPMTSNPGSAGSNTHGAGHSSQHSHPEPLCGVPPFYKARGKCKLPEVFRIFSPLRLQGLLDRTSPTALHLTDCNPPLREVHETFRVPDEQNSRGSIRPKKQAKRRLPICIRLPPPPSRNIRWQSLPVESHFLVSASSLSRIRV